MAKQKCFVKDCGKQQPNGLSLYGIEVNLLTILFVIRTLNCT